jgi:hypothetical protein
MQSLDLISNSICDVYFKGNRMNYVSVTCTIFGYKGESTESNYF